MRAGVARFGHPWQLWANLGASRDMRKAVEDALTFALARLVGGMILSGPNACRGSTKDARIFPVFLHSPAEKRETVSDVTG